MKRLVLSLAFLALPLAASASAGSIPTASGNALDGHAVILPRDLSQHATVLILGFTQHSQDATTEWEKATRASFAGTGVAYFDIPFLEDAPGFIRPMIVRSIRKQVPEILRPHFVPLSSGQAAWKQTVGFTSDAANAAYVVLVDRNGEILWQTHQPYSPALFEQLSHAAKKITAENR
jgi:hypothetical protein